MEKETLESKKRHLEDEFENFRYKIQKYKYVCLFGTGGCAEHWGYEFVKEWMGEKGNILFFSDNNPDNWRKTVIDGLKCLPPDAMLQYGKDIICIVLTSVSSQSEILRQLENQGTEAIAVNIEWVYIDYLVEKYLDIKLPAVWEGEPDMGKYYNNASKNERIAVYTCIVDGYDELKQPFICDPRCDYYCLGLEKPKELGIYQWINITDMFPPNLIRDYTRINRYCKIHPHLFFTQHQYSIYIDGNISVHTKLAHLIERIGRIGIASYGMPTAGDAYEHAASLFLRNGIGEKNARERIRRQMQRYADEGFPRYFGLAENGVMIRKHNNEKCIQIMETWWNELLIYSRRDQLSFMYAVWKNGFAPQDIGYIANTWRNGPEFSPNAHNKDLSSKKFYKTS